MHCWGRTGRIAIFGGKAGRMIYLDNAATSLYRPKEVAQAVAEAMGAIGNCGRGTSPASLSSARVV